MPGIKLYTSNRLEILAAQLAEVLRIPLSSPLMSEIILVQSKGMERWISMELAARLGICANYRFPFPNHFVYQVFREFIPDLPEASPFDPAIMAWEIMKILPPCLTREGFESLRGYLREDSIHLKRYQLATRIADLFDQYLLFRPDMIRAWENNEEGHWQAVLWRELVQGKPKIHRAALLDAFLGKMEKAEVRFATLPERISVFGISALPPFHLRVLKEISRFLEVNLFLMNPCREYWADIVSGREVIRVMEREKKVESSPEDLHLDRGNSLLASMGMLGREFFGLVAELGGEEQELFVDPAPDNLLSCLQGDVLNLADRGRSSPEKTPVMEDDTSLQIHA